MTIRECILAGGPYDGWGGEFVDTAQRSAAFGPDGSKNFIYVRRATKPGKPVRFGYSEKLTDAALRTAGVPAALRAIAVEPPRHDTDSVGPVHDGPGLVNMAVSVVAAGAEWLMKVDGEVVAAVPRSLVTDSESAKAWVRSVLLPEVAA